jgi:zinc D-Ala-D-Ala dipeptidase
MLQDTTPEQTAEWLLAVKPCCRSSYYIGPMFAATLLTAATSLLPACQQHPRPLQPSPTTASVNTPQLPIAPDAAAETLLVDIRARDSTIRVDPRYATSNNFTGKPLPGYEAPRSLLRREAAAALAKVQARLRSKGLGLLLYDGYRPVRATLAMVDWAKQSGREDLLRQEYIARRSRHNLGLAVDLTLADLDSGIELEMGTPFDTFAESARTANAEGQVFRNRQILVRAMEAEGFRNYDREWWHFSYPLEGALPFDKVIR